jgi:hypothetical protein
VHIFFEEKARVPLNVRLLLLVSMSGSNVRNAMICSDCFARTGDF